MRVILVTAPSASAASLARGLVEAGLAACVGSMPLRSVYRWKGAIEEADEVQLVIKTAAPFEAVRSWVRARHPYEVPELVALEITEADEAYAAWLKEP
jgi:periplasmic divalent cation tolerance protein